MFNRSSALGLSKSKYCYVALCYFINFCHLFQGRSPNRSSLGPVRLRVRLDIEHELEAIPPFQNLVSIISSLDVSSCNACAERSLLSSLCFPLSSPLTTTGRLRHNNSRDDLNSEILNTYRTGLTMELV